MADPFIGEIRLFSFNIPGGAPKGWAPCNGQELQIRQNQALYAILGTTYGGNGTTTFNLPNLQGCVPVHVGGQGCGVYSGEESHTLTVNEMPGHIHQVRGQSAAADSSAPAPGPPTSYKSYAWGTSSTFTPYATSGNTPLAQAAIGQTGGSQPHPNMQPYLVLNFCIALVGIFPSRQ